MKDKKSPDPAPAAAPDPTAIYELTTDGPLKVGGVLAYRGARLKLRKSQADALNASAPGTVQFLGI